MMHKNILTCALTFLFIVALLSTAAQPTVAAAEGWPDYNTLGGTTGRWLQESLCYSTATPLNNIYGQIGEALPLGLCVFGTITTYEHKWDFAKLSVGNSSGDGSCAAPTFENYAFMPILVGPKHFDGTVGYALKTIVVDASTNKFENRSDAVVHYGPGLVPTLLVNTSSTFVPDFNGTQGKCVELLRIETHPAMRTRHYNTTGSAAAAVDAYSTESRLPCFASDSVLVYENATALTDAPADGKKVSSASSASASSRRLVGYTPATPAPDIWNCVDAVKSNFTTYGELVNGTKWGIQDVFFSSLYGTRCNASTQAHIATNYPINGQCIQDRFRYTDCSIAPNGTATTTDCVTLAFFSDAACTVPTDDPASRFDGNKLAPFVNSAPQTIDVICSTNSTNSTLQFYMPFHLQARCTSNSTHNNVVTLYNDCGDQDFQQCSYEDTPLGATSECKPSNIFPGRYAKLVTATPKQCKTVKVVEYSGARCSGSLNSTAVFAADACGMDGTGFFCPEWSKTKFRLPTFRIIDNNVTKSQSTLLKENLVTLFATNGDTGVKTTDFEIESIETANVKVGDGTAKTTEKTMFRIRVAQPQLAAKLNSVFIASEYQNLETSSSSATILQIATEFPINYFAPLPEEELLTLIDLIMIGIAGFMFVLVPMMVCFCRKCDECEEDAEAEKEALREANVREMQEAEMDDDDGDVEGGDDE